ncbi:MAG TPA: hypothetical protein VMF68_16775, partial [Spirochaetia bacterium]|nr:hypothetical protein [Spirochaetia bacterium]
MRAELAGWTGFAEAGGRGGGVAGVFTGAGFGALGLVSPGFEAAATLVAAAGTTGAANLNDPPWDGRWGSR